MEIVLGAVIVLAALAFVIAPLFRGQADGTVEPMPVEDADTLASRRAAIYQEIAELQFDRRLGKLDDADYQALSEACLARAAALLADADAHDAAVDEEAEQEIAAVREHLGAAALADGAGRKTA